jgi:hypothetical protein
MVSAEKVKKGIRNYAEAEILQKLPHKSAKRFAMGTVISLIAESATALDSPFIEMLGVSHEGNFDIDKVAEKMKHNMPEEGIELPIKVFGIHFTDMVFKRADVDSLRNYIMNA